MYLERKEILRMAKKELLLQAAGDGWGAWALEEGKESGARGGRRCCGASGRRLSDDCWARAAR